MTLLQFKHCGFVGNTTIILNHFQTSPMPDLMCDNDLDDKENWDSTNKPALSPDLFVGILTPEKATPSDNPHTTPSQSCDERSRTVSNYGMFAAEACQVAAVVPAARVAAVALVARRAASLKKIKTTT